MGRTTKRPAASASKRAAAVRERADSPAALASLVLVAGALPLAATPLATDPVMPVRLVVIGLAVALGLLVRARAGLSRPLLGALAAGLVVFVVAALAGPTPLVSLLGRYPRYEGLPMMLAYAAALVIGARILQRPRYHRIFLTVLSLAACANALVAVGQLVVDPGSRVVGLLGNSTTLGTYGLVVLAVVGWALATEPRPALWAGAVAGAACIVLSASRGVLVGTVAALVVALFVRRVATKPPRWQHLALGAVAVVGAALLVPQTAARVTGASPFSSSTISGRLQLWQESLRLLVAHPFLGTGPSTFVDAINRFHTAGWAATVGPYAPPDSPHDVLLQVLCATGLLGLLALGAVAFVAGRDAWRLKAALLGPAAMVAVGLVATYATSFTDPVTTTLGAFVVGGALAARPYAPAPSVTRIAPAVATLAATGFLAGTLLVAEASYSTAVTAADPTAAALRAIAARPWDPDLVRRVAYTVSARAQTAKVPTDYLVAPITAACASLPSSIECLLTAASVYDTAGDPARALTSAETALGIDPYNVDAHLARGIALAGLTRYAEAETAFKAAADLRPNAPEPWRDLAQLYTLMGRPADATTAQATADALAKR